MSIQGWASYHNAEKARRVRLKDKKISIAKSGWTTDDEGVSTEATVWMAKDLWAYARQVDQTRRTNTTAPYNAEEMLFYVNWRDDLEAGQYVAYKGKLFQVTRVDVYEGYKRDIAIYAKTAPTGAPSIDDITG